MNPSYTKVNHCRVCGSENITDLEIDKNFYLMNLDQTVSLSYAVCMDCQFIFHGECVGDEYLENYYKRSTMLRRREPTEFEVDQGKRQSDFLIKHMDLKNKNALEIGAHTGSFLMHLHKEYDCQAYFNELSVEAIKVLSSQEGLTDYQTVPQDMKMDLVILRHVLEHIFDLDSFIKYVRTILGDDGYLFVEVPDWSWLDEHTDPFIFEHLNQFSTHNLIHLMKRLGWQCEAVEKSIVADDPATPNRVQRLLFRPTAIPVLNDSLIVKTIQNFYQDVYGKGNTAINELILNIDKNKKIALYPASHLTFAALNESNLKQANIIGMFDIDTKKHGKIIEGVEVYPAQKLKDYMPDLILLFTMGYEREIRNSFNEMGLTSEVISITQLLNDSSLQ